MSIGPSSDQAQRAPWQFADLPSDHSSKEQDGHRRLERGVGACMVDAFVGGQIGVGFGGQRDQRLQVVADDFGGNILDHGLLS